MSHAEPTPLGAHDCLTYGHLVPVFRLMLVQKEVPNYLLCIIVPKLEDFDFKSAQFPVIPDEDIIVHRAMVLACVIRKFQYIKPFALNGFLCVAKTIKCFRNNCHIWRAFEDFAFEILILKFVHKLLNLWVG